MNLQLYLVIDYFKVTFLLLFAKAVLEKAAAIDIEAFSPGEAL